jgi:hypothetical protein
MSGDTECCICKKHLSHQSLWKHHFSKAHTSDIEDAILRGRVFVEPWIVEFEAGKKPPDRPLPSLTFSTGANKRFYVCIPCKYIGGTHKEHLCHKDIPQAIASRKANIAYYKDVLGSADKQKRFQTKPVKEVQTDACVGGEASLEEVVRLQKKIDTLQKRIKMDEAVVDEAEDTSDGLFTVLGFLQELNLDLMINAMKKLKALHPVVYERQKKNFGSDWDEGLMADAEEED